MFRRLFKLLLALLVLAFIAAVGLVVMIGSVEDPLSFTIVNQQAAGDGGTVLECEMKNTSVFPMDFLPASLTLLPAEDARAAFLLAEEASSDEVRLTPGETWRGRLQGPQPVNSSGIHTFSYDWSAWGQVRLREFHRWLDKNATFLPDSWLAALYWQTEPRKGRVKHVAMPGKAVTGSDSRVGP